MDDSIARALVAKIAEKLPAQEVEIEEVQSQPLSSIHCPLGPWLALGGHSSINNALWSS
jgi:hypothetical protein